MTRPLATPVAILVGCSLIALAIYFGLRSQPTAVPEGRTSTEPSTTAPPTPASSEPRPTPTPSSGTTDEERATAEAALATLKSELSKTCWRDLPERAPRARFVFQSTFGPDGREIARGISDVRGLEAPKVGACLRRQPLELRLDPAPGRRVRFDLTLELP